MIRKNYVFIAKSIDGFIADKDGNIDWLNIIPNPDNLDMGYNHFINKIEAIVMGRATFDKVLSFDIDWPYQVPVFVVSSSLKLIPEKCRGKADIISGSASEILQTIHNKGYNHLYIDGGKTIQMFLQEDLIDELSITTIPLMVGNGIPLFSILSNQLRFEHIKTEVFLDELVQSDYRRKRDG